MPATTRSAGDLGPVGERHRADRARAVAAKAGDRRSEPEIDATATVELRVIRRELAGGDPREQSRQGFHDGCRKACLDRDGRDLEPDVAAPNHHDPLGAVHRGPDPIRVLDGTEVEHAFEVRPRHAVEPADPASGREKQPVIVEGAARRELDTVRSGVDRGCPGTGQELDGALGVELRRPQQHAVEPGAAGEVVLGEGRALVGWLVLRGHQEHLAVEPFPAEAVHGLAARLSAPHHDDPRYLSHACVRSSSFRLLPGTGAAARGEPPKVPFCGGCR